MQANTVESAKSQGKRRVRIVMSCDQCRFKKVKCAKVPGHIACKACVQSNGPCTFRDRDHYQVQRDAINAQRIAPGGSPSGSDREANISAYSSGHSTPLGAQGASMAFYSFAMSPDKPDTSSGSTPEPEPSQFTFSAGVSHSSPSLRSTPTDSHSDRSSSTRPSSADTEQPPNPALHVLWSPENPAQPNPALMPHFIDVFFTHLAPAFPFMRYECVVGDYFTSCLSPLVENCVAALAVPFAFELKELECVNLRDAAVLYAENAKALVPHSEEMVSQPDIFGLVLLSHYEVQSGHSSEFRWYAQRAIKAAIAFGVTDELAINTLTDSELHRVVLRDLWRSICHLRRMISW